MIKTMRDVVTHRIYEEALADVFYGKKNMRKIYLHGMTKTSANKEKTTKSENFLTNPEKMTGFP